MKNTNPHVREIGQTGMHFTTIGLGTWGMERNPKKSVAALRAGIDAGANHLDTAEMYGKGEVEEIVDEAIQGRRDKVFLVSKVLPSHGRHEDTLAACERTLRRMNTDHLDLYLLHWRESDVSFEETFGAFEQLKSDGKIRAWGVSNFSVSDLEEAVRLVGPGKIACNQVKYHLNERSIEPELLPWCRKNNISVVAYSPLGQGHAPHHAVLHEIAKAHNASTAQIALAFLTNDPAVFAVPKSSDVARAQENVAAMNITLSADEIRKISDAFAVKPKT
jgi:diketogulonate reductase-like aldo/keto reductase